MKWWSSNESNMINGSDGSSFHPLIGKNESLYIFSPDLCRYCIQKLKTLTLVFDENMPLMLDLKIFEPND